ncbi:hypothetical protein HDU98_004136 [Podochytrium sp. JEL0797]|nr:hypothetical protein HDU98_004136 [Podochytrium sp. JEL0797]
MKFTTALGLLATAFATVKAQQYPDVVMLSNCFNDASTWREVDWYPTIAASKAGNMGAGAASTKVSVSQFEGNQFTINYPDGNQLTVDIFSGSNNLGVNQYGGYAWNNYHSFYCYRDNGRQVWGWDTGAHGAHCLAAYYCML